MSEAEAKLMADHATYWREWMAKGHVVAFGVVADPAGVYGIGIVEVEDEAGVRMLTEYDPTILRGQGFRFDVHLMPRGAVHPPMSAA
jgi:YCII-related domain